MKKTMRVLGILYLVQTLAIVPTCVMELYSLWSSTSWNKNDSFSTTTLILVEAVFFLLFFGFSLGTTIVLLRHKRLWTGIVLAALTPLPAIVCFETVLGPSDFGWIAYPGAEVLLGLVTIIVLRVNLACGEKSHIPLQ